MSKKDDKTSGITIKEDVILSDADVITVFRSEGKLEILKLLIKEEMNIHSIKNTLAKKDIKMNPGTIKRHLDQLLEYNMIIQTSETENSWGVRMKYYRAVAKRYTVHFSWP